MKKKKPIVDAVEKLQKQKEELRKEISELEKIEIGEGQQNRDVEGDDTNLAQRDLDLESSNIPAKRLRSADLLILPLI